MKSHPIKVTKLICDFSQKKISDMKLKINISGNIFIPKDKNDIRCFAICILHIENEREENIINIETSCPIDYEEKDSDEVKKNRIKDQVFPVVYNFLKDYYESFTKKLVAKLPDLPDILN